MFSVTIREKSGQVYTFHFDKPEIMIGRVKGNDVILPKQNISKRHALVRSHARANFVIEDLASTNGTYVNGHRIASPVEISSEDKVYLGDFVMQFFDLGDAQHDDEPAVEAAPSAAPKESRAPVETDADGLADFDALDEGDRPADDEDEALPEVPDVPDVPDAAEVPDVPDAFEDEDDPMAELARLMADSEDDEGAGSESVGPPSLLDDGDFGATSAVASMDPDAALDALDDFRMTGPVDGLSDALMGATQAVPEFAPAGRRVVDTGRGAPDFELPDTQSARAGSASGTGGLSTSRRPAAQRTPVDDAYIVGLSVLYDRGLGEFDSVLPDNSSLLSEEEWGALEARIIAFVDRQSEDEALEGLDLPRLKRDLLYELAGLGPLEELLDDEAVEAVAVNGPAAIYATRQGVRELCEARFSSLRAMATAVERLARATGIRVNEHTSSATGTLSDGTSVRVVWPPLCPGGPVLVLRKPRTSAPTLAELVRKGRVTGAAAMCLREAMAQGRSLAICGPSNSGRRTVLNALALEIAPDERIVVAEESVRIHLNHANVVRLDGSAAGQEAAALIGLAAGLRPDRLLLGGMKAGRIAELLDLACDGIAPWMAFFHAGDIHDLLRRVVHSYAVHHAGVAIETCEARTASALDVVAVISRDEAGAYVLDQVHEVTMDTEGLGTHSLLDD